MEDDGELIALLPRLKGFLSMAGKGISSLKLDFCPTGPMVGVNLVVEQNQPRIMVTLFVQSKEASNKIHYTN